MDELLQEFIAETRETLESELVAWECDPGDRDRLDSIFRFFHTMKGSCGFLSLPRFERLSHVAEDALSDVRDGKIEPSPALVSAILSIIDRISELTVALEQGDAVHDDDATLTAALAFAMAGEATAQSATAIEDELPDADSGHDTAHNDHAAAGPVRSIRVPLALIDQMMSGVSDLVLSRNEVARRMREAGSDAALLAAFDRLSGCVAELRDAIGMTRMQRMERLFSPLPRLVRELRNELGKQVELVTTGGDVELDREMIEVIRDPLTHLIRNSLDHGIETPADRVAAGKTAAGTLSITARQSGNQILIEIVDDGRGIDIDRVTAKALAARVVSPTDVQAMNGRQRAELIFAAGLSTASTVTAVSGRGVGMDVVKANVEKIGGSIDLDNMPGKGLRVVMRVPLTLTIISCLTVEVEHEGSCQQFSLPRSAVREILFADNEHARIESPGGVCLLYLRGECMPYVPLEEILGLPVPAHDAADRTIIAISTGDMQYALGVSSVLDHEELVVRPGAPLVMASGIYAGTTLPDNGKPMLLLDPMGIASLAEIAETMARLPRATAPLVTDHARALEDQALIFADLAGRRRAIRLSVIERIEDMPVDRLGFAGGRLRLAIGDRSWPVLGIDHIPESGTIKLLEIAHEGTELYFAISDIADIAVLPSVMEPAEGDPLVMGVAVIGGSMVEIINIGTLLKRASGDAPPPAMRPRCNFVGTGDEWAHRLLAPLVESVGYQVVWSETPDPSARMVIALDDTPVPQGEDASVIDLSSAREDARADLYDVVDRLRQALGGRR